MAEPSLVGRRLRAYRRRAKMTQLELSEATGIARSTISVVEAGIQPGFAVENLIKICDVLGLSLDQLARPSPDDDEDSPPPDVKGSSCTTLRHMWREKSKLTRECDSS